MRIVALSDTHNAHRNISVPDGDIVIHAGDSCINGTVEEALDFVRWFAELPHKHRIFIGGNHDGALMDASWLEGVLNHYPKWDSIEGGIVYLEGTTIDVTVGKRMLLVHGAPYRNRPNDWVDNAPLRPGKRTSAFGVRESEIARFWEDIPEDIDILVTHVPPYGILDKVEETPLSPATQIGCKALHARLQAMNWAPAIHIFGHVHDPGGQNTTMNNGVRSYNVAICDADYAPIRKPTVIELVDL